MLLSDETSPTSDPFSLHRFLAAQGDVYAQVLLELSRGDKQSHWMWYIFPQLDGLAFSSTSKFYAIKTLDEAKAYLNHPVLGQRLLECAELALQVEGRTANEMFGSPDDLKLNSCATLFACVVPPNSAFDRLLAKFYDGERDAKTLGLLNLLK